MTDVDDRIAKLKEAKAKPTRENPEERDQLVVLSSRILAEAEAIHQERKCGEAASREQAEQWQHSLKHYATQTIQALRGDMQKLQAENEQALEQWAARLEDLAAVNRMLGKGLLFLSIILMAMFASELFQ